MAPNVLITGAAGYIGGSIVTTLENDTTSPFQQNNVFAAVRSQEQADAFQGQGVKVLQLDLSNASAVSEAIAKNNISIIVHTASALDASLAVHLIDALNEQQAKTGQKTYFIHTSGLSAFFEKTGWRTGSFKDTDSIFEMEKETADSFPIRKTDVTVVEHAKKQGVTSFIVIPPHVYGRGSGAWNQLSIVLPVFIKGIISQKKVYKFPEDTKTSAVHVSDIATLYVKLLDKIVLGEAIPSGTQGYYFALAHEFPWYETLDKLTAALHARGLVNDTAIDNWPSDEAAAKALNVPLEFVQILWNSGENVTQENTKLLGWKPKWDKARFLQNMDGEIQDVLDLGKPKSSLVDSLSQNSSK